MPHHTPSHDAPSHTVRSIARTSPFGRRRAGFDGLRHAMDRFFDPGPGGTFARSPFTVRLQDVRWQGGAMPLDLSERDGELVVRASLPGFAKDDIDVQLHDGVLTIAAEREQADEQEEERYIRRERSHEAVSRSIALPAADPDAEVDAELADGVLTLTIATPEARKPRQIEIKSG